MSNEVKDDTVTKELRAIKNLLILALYGFGFPSEEVGKAAEMHPGTVRKMFSKAALKKSSVQKGEYPE